MYLGRPHGIKLDDVTVPQPSAFTDSNSPLEMKMAAAWADIMEITGHICDALFVLLSGHPSLADLIGTAII